MDKEMQQFQDDLMEAVRDMKAGRAARTHRVPLTPAADARAHAGLSQSQVCRTSGRVGTHLAGLGTRP
jgi:putative transcriptional regulator